MELGTFLTIVFFFHFALCFTDFILKSCMCQPYFALLDHLGITIKPFQVRICTTLFNRPLAKWALSKYMLQKLWFTAGVVVVLLALIPSVVLLLVNIIQWLGRISAGKGHHGEQQQQQLLQPVVPGVNLSGDDVPLYCLTILVASVLHEAGHAVAAVREGVHVDGVGLLILFILPGAFVMLPADAMATLHPYRRLKILCGGVWHNIVLVAGAVAVALLAPTLLTPLYEQGRGAIVLELMKNSPALGARGLYPLDMVTSINDCTVVGGTTWHNCLLDALVTQQRGYCIPDHIVYNMDETSQHTSNGEADTIICCRKSTSDDHLCFELLSDSADTVPMHPYTCLPARAAIARSPQSCRTTSECPETFFCLAPSLVDGVRLLRIGRLPIGPEAAPPQAGALHRGRRLTGSRALSNQTQGEKHSPTGHHFSRKSFSDRYNNGTSSYVKLANRMYSSKESFSSFSGTVLRALKQVANISQGGSLESRRTISETSKIAKRYAPGATETVAPNNNYDEMPDDGHRHDKDVAADFTDVLYLGSPALLFQTVVVSDYRPRFPFLPLGCIEFMIKVCDYFIKFSGALALLNLIPCVYLDGQYIAEAVVEWTLIDRMGVTGRAVLLNVLTLFGTALVLVNVIIGFGSLVGATS